MKILRDGKSKTGCGAIVLFVLATLLATNKPCLGATRGEKAVVAKALSNGIEIRSDKILLQILALRDDVLRVRESVGEELPEDASWAVPQTIRQRSIQVISETSDEALGFRTNTLRVSIERHSLALSITDLQGHVLQEDAPGWPIETHGSEFRVFKKMPRTSTTLA